MMSVQMHEPERKLAAILAADVVGFSRMMGADETGTLARLGAARRDVIDPLLAAHRGRIFKVMGDGLLVEFPSAVLALRAAIAVQTRLLARNGEFRAEHRIVLRIGLHQGDVVVQDSDLLGNGVNVAARLEPLAEPGGICISARVREDAAGKIALAVEDGGEQVLKNISQPLRVFHVRLGAETELAAPAAVVAPTRTALAGISFAGGGGDAAVRLADRLKDDLEPLLSRLRWLPVVPSAWRIGFGARHEAQRSGRDLGLPCVLHGSVRQDGNQLRVTVGLVERATGRLLWEDQQDGALDEAEALRRRVAALVAEAVERRLGSSAPSAAVSADDDQTIATALGSGVHKLVLLEAPQSGNRPGREVPITLAPLTIGRLAPSNLILIGNDVSRVHCRVELVKSAVIVTDLRSTNGTFVDDRRVARPTRLRPGALVRVGPHVMRYVWQNSPEMANVNATMVLTRAPDLLRGGY